MATDSIWTVIDGEVDLNRGVVVRQGDVHTLTTRELQLLRYLVTNEGEAVHRDALLRDVWGYQGRIPSTRAPDFAVRRLRSKIEPDPSNPQLLLTVRNHGYRLVRPATTDPTSLPIKPQPPQSSLPHQHDSFVGRRELLEQLQNSLAHTTVVTLLGPGGSGKTRMAVQYATLQAEEVCFCELSGIEDVGGLMACVAHVLGVSTPDPDRDSLGQVLEGRGKVLVILDGAEGLASTLNERVAHWRSQAPQARFLLTSRVRFRMPGELALFVGPLAPEEGAALFRERARTAGAPPIGPAHERALSELVYLLDGLPLAIELAAARSPVLSLEGLVAKMSERFKLLTERRGTGSHATLRAVLEASWSRTDAECREALAQLSVFPGSFTLEAAEAVVRVENAWTMDLLERLVDQSLVRLQDRGRFRMLHSVREFAAEHLDDPIAAEVRHGRYYAGLDAEPNAIETTQPVLGIRRLAMTNERENLVTACRRAVARGDGEVAPQVLSWLTHVVSMQGGRALLRELTDLVATVPGLTPIGQAAIEGARGLLKELSAPTETIQHWRAERDLSLAGGHAYRATGALVRLAHKVRWLQGHDEARALYNQAIAEAQAVGAAELEARALHGLGQIALTEWKLSEAKEWMQRAIARSREGHHPAYESRIQSTLAKLSAALGDPERAERLLLRALETADRYGESVHAARLECDIGMMRHMQGAFDAATEALDRSLESARRLGCSPTTIATVIIRKAFGALLQGKDNEARDLAEQGLQRIAGFAPSYQQGLGHYIVAMVSHRRGEESLAAQAWQRGIEICEAVNEPLIAGHHRLARASHHASQGRFGAAHADLDAVKQTPAKFDDGFLWSRWLAVKAEVTWLEGNHDAAHEWLAQAEAKRWPMRFDATSEIERVRRILAGTATTP
ncbi:MAG: winged helix-turn-helix domain-containing protein [Myxococcota bacterium]